VTGNSSEVESIIEVWQTPSCFRRIYRHSNSASRGVAGIYAMELSIIILIWVLKPLEWNGMGFLARKILRADWLLFPIPFHFPIGLWRALGGVVPRV